MTASSKQYLKTNWISFANLVLLVTIVGSQFAWKQKVNSHIIDDSIHMKLERTIEVFVPRTELDVRLRNIEKLLDKIDAKLPA